MPAPLRVAFVSLHTSPAATPGSPDAGGMNVVELAQADALAERGHQVDLITRRTEPDQPDVVGLRPGVRLRHLAAGPVAHLGKAEQEELVPAFAAELARLEPYDLIHSQHWLSGLAALPVARAWGVPHVQSYHSVAAPPGASLDDGEQPESPGRIQGERRLAAESDQVVAVSDAEARTVITRCGADPARVTVIRPAVDHDLFRPLLPGEDPWPGAPAGFCLMAGRLEPLKAPDLAVAAVATLPPAQRAHLVVAGEASAAFSGYAEELHALPARLGVEDRVTFLGSRPRSELAHLLRSASVVLVPSHSETFGLIALEAEASGVPVVARRTGGLSEAVADGRSGLLVDGGAPAAWGEALSRALEPAEHARLSAGAIEHAAGFDWSTVAEQLEQTYAALLTSPAVRA